MRDVFTSMQALLATATTAKPVGLLVFERMQRDPTGFQEEPMVSLPGVRCKEYVEGQAAIPQMSCPNPECRKTPLQGHGSYHRRLFGDLQAVARGRCPRCGVTHALFPEDLCAYRDATFAAVEAAFSAGTPSAGAEASGQDDAAAARRVRRWLRSQKEGWSKALMGLLPAVEGPWWVRAQALVGASRGWLTRLRHWLWSSFLCFLGGVHGLYRYGRPRLALVEETNTPW